MIDLDAKKLTGRDASMESTVDSRGLAGMASQLVIPQLLENSDFAHAVCPACHGSAKHLTHWEFSGLGDSIFNYVGNFFSCGDCGLVYILNIDDARLSRFYLEECSYFEKAHFDVASPANSQKYAAYRNFIVSRGLANVRVADIGCGRGGFLNWLKRGGWDAECCGVDIDARSIPRDDGGVLFERGQALDLPFVDNSQSLLTYFHVVEHIRDIDNLLAEAFRTLEAGGHLLIEVPDAENYGAITIGSAFWISIREHVYHFSPCSLERVLRRHGFSVIEMVQQILPTPEFVYPSLMLLARKDAHGISMKAPSRGNVASFVLESKRALQHQVERVNMLFAKYPKVTFWGCSAELLSLLPLVQTDKASICDASEQKQKCRYKQLPIRNPEDVEPEGVLVIAPYLHGEAIERAALRIGWRPEAIVKLN